MTGGAICLGVTRSTAGRIWRFRLDDDARATALAQRLGVPEAVARILAGRGFDGPEADRHFDPSLKAWMPDPSSIDGLDAAAARLADAIAADESTAVFGDYDVDGGASSAMVLRYFRALGRALRLYIPDRLTRGCSQSGGHACPRGGRRQARRHRRLRRPGLRGARRRRRGGASVFADHHLMGAGAPPALAIVDPNRPARPVRARPSLRGGRRLHAARGRQPRAAPPRLVRRRRRRRAGPSPPARSGRAGDGLRRRPAHRPQPGLRPPRAEDAGGGRQCGPRRAGAGGGPQGQAPGQPFRLRPRPARQCGRPGRPLRPRGAAAGERRPRLRRSRRAGARPLQSGTSGDRGDGASGRARRGRAPGAGQGPRRRLGRELAPRRHRHRRRTPEGPLRPPQRRLRAGGRSRPGLAAQRPGVDLGSAVGAAKAAGLLLTGGGHRMAAAPHQRGRLGEIVAFLEEALAPEVERRSDRGVFRIDAVVEAARPDAGILRPDRAGRSLRRGQPGAGRGGAGRAHRGRPNRRRTMSRSSPCAAARGSRGSPSRAAETPLGEALLRRAGALHLAGKLLANDWQGQRRIELWVEDAAHL